jgi:hypothetical protein
MCVHFLALTQNIAAPCLLDGVDHQTTSTQYSITHVHTFMSHTIIKARVCMYVCLHLHGGGPCRNFGRT